MSKNAESFIYYEVCHCIYDMATDLLSIQRGVEEEVPVKIK